MKNLKFKTTIAILIVLLFGFGGCGMSTDEDKEANNAFAEQNGVCGVECGITCD